VKRAISCAEAVAHITDGASIMIGGFMGVGTPERLVDALVATGRHGLTIIANDTARPGVGIGKLISSGQCRKAVVSHIGLNPETQRRMIEGSLEVELVPQGTLAERVRAGGYGLGGILTATGIGTLAAEGKTSVTIDGKDYLIELPIRADFALIKAKEADYIGNLNYSLTACNFNPLMAMAADCVIAEADEIVPVGMVRPDDVDTPGVLVDHLVRKAS
jgi:acetate CoA/acetoacetate CoA-transferase alpha subunit